MMSIGHALTSIYFFYLFPVIAKIKKLKKLNQFAFKCLLKMALAFFLIKISAYA